MRTTIGYKTKKGHMILNHDDLLHLLSLSSDSHNSVMLGESSFGGGFYAYMLEPRKEDNSSPAKVNLHGDREERDLSVKLSLESENKRESK